MGTHDAASANAALTGDIMGQLSTLAHMQGGGAPSDRHDGGTQLTMHATAICPRLIVKALIRMQFIEAFYNALWPNKRFPGLDVVIAHGSHREKCVVINALNTLGVNAGVREGCEFVGYMLGRMELPDGALIGHDADPPAGSKRAVGARIRAAIRRHCQNAAMVRGEAVLSKKSKWLGHGRPLNDAILSKVLGYHGGEKGPIHGRLNVMMQALFTPPDSTPAPPLTLYSWSSDGNDSSIAATYGTFRKWDSLLDSVHPMLGASMTLDNIRG